MPRGDGTGPEGLGPMTGRGLGYCAGYSSPGFTKGVGRGLARGRGRGIGRGLGRGFRGGRGRGRGFGRGFRRRPYIPPARVPQYRPPVRNPYRHPTDIPVYQPNMANQRPYEPRGVTNPQYNRSPQTQAREGAYTGQARENEKEYLKEYAESLRTELEEIEARIDEISE